MSENTQTQENVPIDLGDDPLVRLKNLLKLFAAAILKLFPTLTTFLFIVLLAILALLAVFSRIFFPSQIP